MVFIIKISLSEYISKKHQPFTHFLYFYLFSLTFRPYIFQAFHYMASVIHFIYTPPLENQLVYHYEHLVSPVAS